ncbi:MAG TPA: alpha/beta hydrolase [Pirellulales bacterium]|nr:alpha/beta hydrolase [Pirellulales bacterium]
MMPRAGLSILVVFCIATAGCAEASELIHVEHNIEYSNAGDQHLKLDLTRPLKIEGLAPAVVFIHGGAWTTGKRSHWQFACDELARRGFVAVTVQYRLVPAFKFPAQLEDVQAAVRWLRANAERFRIDPERVGAVGVSAGGHLAECLGVGADVERLAPHPANENAGPIDPSCRVQCVVSYYGPCDLTRQVSVGVSNVYLKFLGGTLEQARQKYILASPLFWLTPDAAPTLLIHGTKDDVVAIEQSEIFRDRLKAVGVDAELLPIAQAGHGFEGAGAERAAAAMYDWLERHLKAERK